MKDLTFTEALRFAFSGFMLYIYVYLILPDEATSFSDATGTIGFPLALTVLGSALYFVYRPLYDLLIEPLLDSWPKLGENYRHELCSRFQVTPRQATELFAEVRASHLGDRYSSLAAQSAGIHMTYLTGVLAVIVGGIGAAQEKPTGWLLILLGVLAFVAGCLNDAKYERMERNMLVQVDKKKIEMIATALGYKLKDKS